jgi:hypothetical protein
MSQIPLPESTSAESAKADDVRDDNTRQIAPDVAYRQLAIVNVLFVGAPGADDGKWVLIDAGVPGSAPAIRSAARERFGQSSRPGAIVMTHGHFDHVGSLETLATEWDVPVYAHPLEHPYLDGTRSYPPAGNDRRALLQPRIPFGFFRPRQAGNVFVEPLTAAQGKPEPVRKHLGQSRCRLRNDGGVIAISKSRNHPHRQTGGLHGGAQPRPCKAGLALCRRPGTEMIRGHRTIESGGFRRLDEFKKLGWRELLMRGVIADFRHLDHFPERD